MHNDLFSIFGLTVHSYGLMIGVGFAVALLTAYVRAKHFGLDTERVTDIAIIAMISGIAGAKLLYIIINFKALSVSPLAVLGPEGFVVFGGIIAGIISVYLFCRKKGISFSAYFDLLAPSIAIAQGFGRIGCFLAGCCFGKETNSWFGIVFPEGSMAPSGVKLYPTQLVSSIGDFAIAFFLILYSKRSHPSGKCALLYVAIYSGCRFIIEFFRDDSRGKIGLLSTSQIISLAVLFVCAFLVFRIKKEKQNKTA